MAITVGLLVWAMRTHRIVEATALGLIAGGAAGNIVDRVHQGGDRLSRFSRRQLVSALAFQYGRTLRSALASRSSWRDRFFHPDRRSARRKRPVPESTEDGRAGYIPARLGNSGSRWRNLLPFSLRPALVPGYLSYVALVVPARPAAAVRYPDFTSSARRSCSCLGPRPHLRAAWNHDVDGLTAGDSPTLPDGNQLCLAGSGHRPRIGDDRGSSAS